nr:protein-associating with the carboxyl-terminal domain of ezrin-like [Lytechinus pictus]
MGVESSALSGCTLEDPLPDSASAQDWRIHPAKRPDGSRVSVFVHKHDEDKEHQEIYQHAAKQLKVLRHPTILKFFASCNNVDSTYLVTEQVKPLELVIEMLSPEEICAGMYNIIEALSFLHDRGGVSHNNVCMSSIYVSCSDGGWRLGGMEHLCKFEDATLQFLNQSRPLRNSQAIPPEEKEEGVKTSIGPSIGHARDAYGFGALALTLLEYLGDLGSISSSFSVKMEEQFLNSDPKHRPKLKTLLPDEMFKNDFLDIISFLHKLVLKSELEKTVFFEGLAPHLYRLPAQLVASRLLTPILDSFVMAEPVAVNMLFPHLLTPRRESKKNPEFLPGRINPILPLDMFQRHMIPIIAQVFPSREMHVRSLILQYFSSFVDLFDEGTLRRVILPQLLLGLKDHHTNLVADSLRALAELVHLLGPEVVVGGERIKYFVEGRPKFPKKTSNIKEMLNIPKLTAVSGVITLPGVEPSPMSPPGSYPTKGGAVGSNLEVEEEETSSETGVAVGEDVMVSTARKAEREKRKEEMRIKNEQRRREREEKRKAVMENKAKAPLSPDKEKLGSLAHRLSPEGSIDNGAYPLGEDPPAASPTNIPATDPDETLESEEMTGKNATQDGTEPEEDWSDWEDTDNPGQNRPIESPVRTPTEPIPSSEPNSAHAADWSSDWSRSVSDQSSPKKSITSLKGTGKPLKLKDMVPPQKETPAPKTAETVKPKESKTATFKSTTRTALQSTMKLQKSTLNPNQDFGIYDIPEVKLKSRPDPEDDLFAELAPKLSFISKVSSDAAKSTVRKDSSKDEHTSGALSFAVANDGDEDADGWGDDDWGIDVDD